MQNLPVNRCAHGAASSGIGSIPNPSSGVSSAGSTGCSTECSAVPATVATSSSSTTAATSRKTSPLVVCPGSPGAQLSSSAAFVDGSSHDELGDSSSPLSQTTVGGNSGTGRTFDFGVPCGLAGQDGSSEVSLTDYRGEKVASFDIAGNVMLCLPQAYELFLKHLVGGLHTVYTKLKRLDIKPYVCNVEQVRALRSIGAIQPGVNRCKLISRQHFDMLLEDCASSNSRPGRPLKRGSTTTMGPSANAATADFFASLKRAKYASEEKSHGGIYGNSSFSPLASFLGPTQINPGLLSLFSLTPQQMLMTQMLTANQSAMLGKSWSNYDPSLLGKGFDSIGEDKDLSDQSFDVTKDCDLSSDDESPPIHITKMNCHSHSGASAIGDHGERKDNQVVKNMSVSEDGAHRCTGLSVAKSPMDGFATSPEMNNSGQNSSPADSSNRTSSPQNSYSVDNMLLSILGMVEMAVTAARKQEERFVKDKAALCKAFEAEKKRRMEVEQSSREKEQVYLKRIRRLKDTISHLKFDYLQADQSAMFSNGDEPRSGQSMMSFPTAAISVPCDDGSASQ